MNYLYFEYKYLHTHIYNPLNIIFLLINNTLSKYVFIILFLLCNYIDNNFIYQTATIYNVFNLFNFVYLFKNEL